MSLFLVSGTTLCFFFLCSTAFAPDSRDSIKVFIRGLAASLIALLGLYLFRNLVPEAPGSFLGFLKPWFRDFFWYLAAGLGAFALVPDYRDAYAERERRLECFLFGVFAPSGLATIVAEPSLRDSYFIYMLPILRLCLILLSSRLMHRTIGEYGLRLALGIAALAGLSLVPPLTPFFHFWNARLLALGSFAAMAGAALFVCRGEIAAIFHKELRIYREGR